MFMITRLSITDVTIYLGSSIIISRIRFNLEEVAKNLGGRKFKTGLKTEWAPLGYVAQNILMIAIAAIHNLINYEAHTIT